MIRQFLESPLELVCELIKAAFSTKPNEGLYKYKSQLDDVKKKVASIARAELLSSKGSKIATYAGYLFAFQQFFHSSYRARQGTVLEEVVRYVLEKCKGVIVAKRRGKDGKHSMLKKVYCLEKKLDVDLLAKNESTGKYLIVQLRSADMTGGATAKESLVDLGAKILETKRTIPTLYIIFVWESEIQAQKQTLIDKIWERLKDKIGINYEKEFKENIERGWKVPGSEVEFKLAYGIDEFCDTIKDFTDNKEVGSELKKVWAMLEKWDDLWLVYALTTLELENLTFKGFSNFQILAEKLKESKIRITLDDIKNYKSRSETIAQKIILAWDRDTLPVKAPSDALNYIRDLILLRMMYENLQIHEWSVSKLPSSTQEGALLEYLQGKHLNDL